MSLWDWALKAYARPDVAPACLALQDDHRQSVCFLLWAIWASPTEAELRSGAALAREWDEVVLKPLRGVRRRLPLGELRDEVKALELKAEKSLLETLERVAGASAGDPLAAVTAASAIWNPPAPPEALQRLATAISANEERR